MTNDEFLALPYRPNAGLVLLNSDGHVFAGKRLDTAGNPWQMPQGGIDKGETPEAAAFRELEEETGIAKANVELVAVLPEWLKYDFPPQVAAKLWVNRSGKPKYRGQKQRWYLMRFLGEDAEVNIHTKHPEFSEWCWMPPEQLIENIVPFKREIYEQVLAGFSGYIQRPSK